MRQRFRWAGACILLCITALQCLAQPYDGKKRTNDSPAVTLRVEVTSPTTAAFVDLQKSPDDNAHLGTNQSGRIEVVRDGKVILFWDKNDSERVWKTYNKSYVPEPEKPVKEQKAEKRTDERQKKEADSKPAPPAAVVQAESLTPVSCEAVIADFTEYLDADSYYAQQTIGDFQKTIDEHIDNLRNYTDKDGYIAQHELDSYAREEREKLQHQRDDIEGLIAKFLNRYRKNGVNDREVAEQRMNELAQDRLDLREDALSRLETELGITPPTARSKPVKWVPIALCVLGALLLVALLVWMVRRKKPAGPPPVAPRPVKGGNGAKTNGEPAIVVRRTTTTILKKQSLDDVARNPAYLPIEVSEFCDQAAVRRIYLKNTCVKEIYEMYAQDLRNSPNPNENGCMVLGRWVYDPQQQEYYVSLEEVVMPGDDAVFQEYELNFGGKIKLRATGRLRKLRAQTNLQYDLTCWVHSHPGLGVFFSNADNSVHHQLKHPTHPHFLTAIVVDIMTKGQQMGIFVFRRDGSISSKNDLKRMYSLEKLYQWAVESEKKTNPAATAAPDMPNPARQPAIQQTLTAQPARQPVSPQPAFRQTQPSPAGQNARQTTPPADADSGDEYIDILSQAPARLTGCQSVMVNKHAVEELKQLTDGAQGGVAFIHGSTNGNDEQMACVVERISTQPQTQNMQLLGCVVMAEHLSLPSVKKAVAPYIGLLRFVMVFSAADGLLTTIPVVRQDLCIDEHFYGEQKLEDLISWAKNK